jgi:hypothetical protein
MPPEVWVSFNGNAGVVNVGMGQVFNYFKVFCAEFCGSNLLPTENDQLLAQQHIFRDIQVGLVIEADVARVELMRVAPTDTRSAKR